MSGLAHGDDCSANGRQIGERREKSSACGNAERKMREDAKKK
jgi:hypothetical protein